VKEFWDYLGPVVPNDHSRQVTAHVVVEARIKAGFQPTKILDFGCGDGRSIDLFAKLSPQAEWTGVDIESSPEVLSRVRDDGDFVTYDGENLPFANKSFDLVYSYQVLEHVRKPETVLPEIARILKPEGLFIGQTSQFEPYHSYSLWNFTVFGFKKILEDAGLSLIELRPGIDGFTLMRRTYEGRPAHLNKYFSRESPINQEIELIEEAKSVRQRNLRKLWFCGQFVWVASPRL
jgi:ubiquinone/menaquinone biosynthesis C-methylase UbiE